MNIFLNNKYTKYYYQIVNSAQEKKRKRGKGIARHHVIPAHFYIDNNRKEKDEAKLTAGWLLGNPDEKSNLVYLTHREHLICHLLLRKMIEIEKRAGCIYAAWRMVNYELEDGTIIKCNSRLYDKIRTEVSETHSATMKGRPAHNKNVPMSEEQKQTIRDTKARNKTYETCEHCGKTMVASAIKQYHGDKCEMNPNKDPNIVTVKTRGKKRSEEWKEEHSKILTAYYEENERREKTEEEKEHLSKVLTGVPKAKTHTPRRMATLAKQMEDGTHYSFRKVSCIKTRKVYTITTFTRYVLNN